MSLKYLIYVNFCLNTVLRGVGIFQIGDETVEVDGNKEPTLGKYTNIIRKYKNIKVKL